MKNQAKQNKTTPNLNVDVDVLEEIEKRALPDWESDEVENTPVHTNHMKELWIRRVANKRQRVHFERVRLGEQREASFVSMEVGFGRGKRVQTPQRTPETDRTPIPMGHQFCSSN
ncbi:unnamed protein product [[Candida] boidinii]|nr:unnamed protein product [[Candida] boidinii]